MAKTIVGLFDTFAQAQHVADSLAQLGVKHDAISVVSRSHDAGLDADLGSDEAPESAAPEGSAAGAIGGTLVGGTLGLLVGIGALAIPGIGPVIAAGPLAAALGTAALGAGIGAATGSLLGALVGAGVPEEEAHMYAEGVRRGGTLVSVEADDAIAERVYTLMQGAGAVDVGSRAEGWRDAGWNSFDDRAEPHTVQADTPAGWHEEHEDERGDALAGAEAGATTGAAMGASSGPVGTIVGSIVGAVSGASGDATGAADEPLIDSHARPHADEDTDTRRQSPQRVEVPQPIAGTATQEQRVMSDPKDLSDQNTEAQAADSHGWGWSDYEKDFHTDYDARYATMGSWDNYAAAYRYGHEVARDSRYQGRTWNELEGTLMGAWDDTRYGPWDQFKDAVHTAWERTRQQAS